MLLPVPPSNLEELPLSPLFESTKTRRDIDRALIEKATTLHIVEQLPAVLQNALDLSLTSESDSVRADMTKYLLDRVAGKAISRSEDKTLNVNLNYSREEIADKLNHLNEMYGEEDSGV